LANQNDNSYSGNTCFYPGNATILLSAHTSSLSTLFSFVNQIATS